MVRSCDNMHGAVNRSHRGTFLSFGCKVDFKSTPGFHFNVVFLLQNTVLVHIWVIAFDNPVLLTANCCFYANALCFFFTLGTFLISKGSNILERQSGTTLSCVLHLQCILGAVFSELISRASISTYLIICYDAYFESLIASTLMTSLIRKGIRILYECRYKQTIHSSARI